MLEALAKGGDVPHRVTYIIAQGKHQGDKREYVVTYGAPNPKAITPGVPKAPAKKRNLQGGLLPFTEFGTRRLLSLFTFNIIMFDGKQVIC
jgi:hypothetical protein